MFAVVKMLPPWLDRDHARVPSQPLQLGLGRRDRLGVYSTGAVARRRATHGRRGSFIQPGRLRTMAPCDPYTCTCTGLLKLTAK